MKFIADNVVIREAGEGDAQALGAVHCQAWMETYTGLLPDSFLATRSPEKSASVFRANQCRDMVLAEAESRVVGFCGWGAFRDDCADDSLGEIHGIYLLNAYKRMRLGQKMMEYGLKELKAKGFRSVVLWVLAENADAIRFYEKLGFRYSGIHKEANLGKQVSELLYIKEIG